MLQPPHWACLTFHPWVGSVAGVAALLPSPGTYGMCETELG